MGFAPPHWIKEKRGEDEDLHLHGQVPGVVQALKIDFEFDFLSLFMIVILDDLAESKRNYGLY